MLGASKQCWAHQSNAGRGKQRPYEGILLGRGAACRALCMRQRFCSIQRARIIGARETLLTIKSPFVTEDIRLELSGELPDSDVAIPGALTLIEFAPPAESGNIYEEAGAQSPPDPVPPAGLSGRNIICFAKDWNEDPTSCNHVLRHLSQTNRVLWINSISTRPPSLSSGRDWSKIARKIAGFCKGPRKVSERMWVYTPLVLPWHHNALARALNRKLLRATFALLSRCLDMRPYQLWTWVPTSAPYVAGMGQNRTVYYCTDNWEQFRGMDSRRIGDMVRGLAKQADVVFGTSSSLVAKLRASNPNAHLAAHGVDHAFFARALEDTTPVPADLAALPGPVLGFYGLIEDWLDQDLIVYLATRHPEWSIALVGRTCVDVSALKTLPNVHFLGRKPHAELPLYCKGFAVGLIPHHVNELTRHMNPIKLREYLSAGLPVVSTALPEVRNYGAHCCVADSYADFERAIETALRENTLQARRQRSEAMAWETWERKVEAIGAHVADAAK